ncbi:MAG: hypothetical protein M3N98_10645, partial [Actinomycetota bacterium]|nr:hypothetical protein [Actinomycetota bacterium]
HSADSGIQPIRARGRDQGDAMAVVLVMLVAGAVYGLVVLAVGAFEAALPPRRVTAIRVTVADRSHLGGRGQ